uniref:CFA20 domain-containing protein n=1 Tax=Timema shepardi TaxID=629360 RepID=A0A7R9G3H1_TIMSH|nr:unnamed protein product [Timema shepardi]
MASKGVRSKLVPRLSGTDSAVTSNLATRLFDTDSAVTVLEQPCSFMLRRFLEQSYSRKEVDALCSCQSAEINLDKKPLSLWSKFTRSGRVKRVDDDDLHTKVIEIYGTDPKNTYISSPTDPMASLDITLPILVMLLKNMDKDLQCVALTDSCVGGISV